MSNEIQAPAERNYTFLVTISATGPEEAESFLRGCHDSIVSVDRAEDPSGKHWVDETVDEMDEVEDEVVSRMTDEEIRKAIQAVTFTKEPSPCDEAYSAVVRVAVDMVDTEHSVADNLRFLILELTRIADVIEDIPEKVDEPIEVVTCDVCKKQVPVHEQDDETAFAVGTPEGGVICTDCESERE